jgi:hypothetical protein
VKVQSLTDSPGEGFGTSKKKYSARPSNNHTLILYFTDNGAATWFMLLEDEKPSYSFFQRNNSLFW